MLTIARPRVSAPQAVGAAIFALEMLDVYTTQLILRLPGGGEGNPLIRETMRALGNGWPVPKVCVAAFAAAYFGTRSRVSLIALAAVALCLAVDGNNLWNLFHG
jgi:hypothetical protein